MARLNWDTTSGAMLERVMRYEAVHPFSATDPWGDLGARLAPHRCVFGFFHQSLPDEPLVLLHTALMNHAATNIDEILQHRCNGGFYDFGPKFLAMAKIGYDQDS